MNLFLCIILDQSKEEIINSLKELGCVKKHTSYISGLSISPDNKYFVTGSYDQSIIVSDINTLTDLKKSTFDNYVN